MHNVAWSTAEDRMELILAAEGEAGISAVLVTRKAVSKIPAPRTLADVACQRSNISYLRCRDSFCRFRQYGELPANHIIPAQCVERDQPADIHAAVRRPDLIETFDRFQVHENIGVDDTLFDEREQVATTANERCGASFLSRLLDESRGVLEITSVGIGKSFHASAPRILSRVIGRSFMRRPIALKIALATAATAGTLLDSPMLLAP